MAPEKKEKKRKEAPITAASSEAPQKKLKKQKIAQGPDTLANADVSKSIRDVPENIVSPAAVDVNQPAVKSKKDRIRAADFLSDKEAEILQKPTETTTKTKKTAKKQFKGEQSVNNNAPAAEAPVAAEDAVSTKDVKQPKKAKTSKVVALEAPPNLVTKNKTGKKEVIEKVLSNGDALTADGVNGVLQHSSEEDVEFIAANKDPPSSMPAEAQRTVVKEMADEVATEDDGDDQGVALLAGFDSDGDDSGKDEGLDPANMGDLNLDKKQRKKLRQAAHKGSKDGPGAVYVGRIPRGFYEAQMRQYFSQFGMITNLRLSRNKTTGASKHFAFIEFESNEVAKIVAQTMDNYLMYGHILKCKYAPSESLHPNTWKGANKRFKKVPYNKIEKRKLEEPKTKDQWEVKIARVQGKREKSLAKAQAMGYDYDLPQIQSANAALERKRLAQQEETEAVQPAGATEPPSDIPKDAVALKKEKKPEKLKSEPATRDTVLEVFPTDPSAAAEPLKQVKKKNGTAAPEIVPAATKSEALPEVAATVVGKKAKKAKKIMEDGITAEAVMPSTNAEAPIETLAEISKPTKGKKMKKQKKSALAEVASPDVASSSTVQPGVEPPKFAFHPDEIAELTQKTSKKVKNAKIGTYRATVQIQLNTELNEATKAVKGDTVESDSETAATAAVLLTHSGVERKAEKKARIQSKKEKHKADVLPTESAELPKKAKKVKKLTA